MPFTCTLRGAAQTLNLVSSEEFKNLGGSGFGYRELSTKEIAEGLCLQRGGLAALDHQLSEADLLWLQQYQGAETRNFLLHLVSRKLQQAVSGLATHLQGWGSCVF